MMTPRHDIKDKKAMGTMPEAYPHLIMENFSTKLGERTATILFPMPKPDTKRILTFANQSDYISRSGIMFMKNVEVPTPKSIELKEVGPRFEMRLCQIKLGTMEQAKAQTEWVIRPYMNTTKKRKFIGD